MIEFEPHGSMDPTAIGKLPSLWTRFPNRRIGKFIAEWSVRSGDGAALRVMSRSSRLVDQWTWTVDAGVASLLNRTI